MTNQNIAIALTFGFLAFIATNLAPTPAQAECPKGTHAIINPYGPSRCIPDKLIERNKACPPGFRLDEGSVCVPIATKSIGKSQALRDCQAKGPNYSYDPQTGRCIKSITKVEPPTSGGVGGGGED